MHWIWKDLQYGLRGLRKQPSFTCLAALALALGIGAATTIFSVIQNVLLDPFPYTDARSVVAFQIRDAKSSRPGGRSMFQTFNFQSCRRATASSMAQRLNRSRLRENEAQAIRSKASRAS